LTVEPRQPFQLNQVGNFGPERFGFRTKAKPLVQVGLVGESPTKIPLAPPRAMRPNPDSSSKGRKAEPFKKPE